jgi:hypothetical protein
VCVHDRQDGAPMLQVNGMGWEGQGKEGKGKSEKEAEEPLRWRNEVT